MEEGQQAPDFELTAHDGSRVSLGSLGGKNAVLCFYPKNRLFGCPSKKVFKMAKSMVDAYPEIAATGTEVLAISSDTAESQESFVREHGIPYVHLSDASKEVCKKYAGLNMVGLAKRSTFVIDGEGVVRGIFRDIDVERHGAEILEFLRGLPAGRSNV